MLVNVRMTVLASGSRGNATVVAAAGTAVLVDAGLSCREILRRMAATGEDPAELNAILITHEHLDHVAGLSVLARKLKIPVFFTEATHRAWVRMLTPQKRMSYKAWLEKMQHEREAMEAGVEPAAPEPECAAEEAPKKVCPTALPALEFFEAGRSFRIGELEVCPFTIPHDAADPCGFVFHAPGRVHPDGDCDRSGLCAAECETCAQKCGCAAARIEPRSRDAEGRALIRGA